MRRLHKGDIPSADIAAIAASTDYVFVVGLGKTKLDALTAAGANLYGYVKCSGVRGPTAKGGQDAQWDAAQDLLWRAADGTPYTHRDNLWCYGRIQDHPAEWYAAVVKPQVEALLASAKYKGLLLDNAIGQTPDLFAPSNPEYTPRGYHDGSLVVLALLRRDFPSLEIFPNGWIGSHPVGLRGEALGATIPKGAPGEGLPFCHGVWFEGVRFKASGKRPTDERFVADQGGYIGLANAGRVCVWDELSQKPGTAGFSEAWSAFLGTRSVVTNRDNCVMSVAGPPWADWWKAA